MKIACLILAAGQASRMGQPKQLLPFGKVSLIEHVIGIASKVDFAEIRVVIGAYREKLEAILKKHPVEITFNPHWKTGMGSSIATGVGDVKKDTEAILIMLGDQPFVHPGHLQDLIIQHKESSQPIIASLYKEKLGVPALFDQSFFGQLLDLKGKEGAGKLIKKFSDKVHPITYSKAAIDIDTPEDYLKWKNAF